MAIRRGQRPASNRLPSVYETDARPHALRWRGSRGRGRTSSLPGNNRMLCQLSYTRWHPPGVLPGRVGWETVSARHDWPRLLCARLRVCRLAPGSHPVERFPGALPTELRDRGPGTAPGVRTQSPSGKSGVHSQWCSRGVYSAERNTRSGWQESNLLPPAPKAGGVPVPYIPVRLTGTLRTGVPVRQVCPACQAGPCDVHCLLVLASPLLTTSQRP